MHAVGFLGFQTFGILLIGVEGYMGHYTNSQVSGCPEIGSLTPKIENHREKSMEQHMGSGSMEEN